MPDEHNCAGCSNIAQRSLIFIDKVTECVWVQAHVFARLAYVRFGSEADMCNAPSHVRFAPNSDRESGLPQKVMSALLLKADMCSATRDVRFVPKADIGTLFDHLVRTRLHRR